MKTGKSGRKVKNPIIYIILFIQTLIVLFPIYTMLIIPFKKNADIFKNPYSIPKELNFGNFATVWKKVSFLAFYKNSLIVTVVSLISIVIVSSMTAYALTRYDFKLKSQVYFYFMAGVIIPIRLGVLNIFSIVKALNLFDNLLSLILVYIAMCIPISIIIITNFMKQIPSAIEESAMIDGCSRMRIYTNIIMPLIKPAVATVIVYNFLPIWNDFYFPLIFIRSELNKTIPLGVALFFGQHTTNWAVVFSALTMACVPPLFIYIAFSKYFIQGITAGAVKG